MKISLKIGVVLCFLFAYLGNAQQQINYGNKTFKKAEVIKTQIGNSGESFSFYISEHDMSPNGAWAKECKRLLDLGQTPDPKNAPRGLSLLFSVEFKNKFKFPIQPKDSVVINLSGMIENRQEDDFNAQEISQINTNKMVSEGQDMKSKKVNAEEELKRISKLMIEGKITPEEASKKIDALTQPLINDIDNSYTANVKTEEFGELTNYNIRFSDSNVDTESVILYGNLHIVEFNKNKLVAYVKGKHIVECTDVKRSNDKSSPCHKPSKLYKGIKVIEEGDVYLSINTTFNTFWDNRD